MSALLSIKKHLQNHLGSTLAINSYVIFAMRLLGPGGSFLFWVLAARTLSADSVVLASGIIAAATLLAGLSQLGIGYVLIRFMPHSHDSNRLLNRAIGIVGLVSLIFALVFMTGLSHWSPALLPLYESLPTMVAFCFLVLFFSLSQLFNSIFLARRQPVYSLYKNVIQTSTSIILLLLTIIFLRNHLSAFFAYFLSIFLAVGISLFVFLPRINPSFYLRLSLPKTLNSPFTTFALANYGSDQFLRIPHSLVTLMVINVLGPGTGAYFFAAWMIANGLHSLAGSVPRSLLAEGSNKPDLVSKYARSSVKLSLVLSVGMAVMTALFSKFILSVFGDFYYLNSRLLFLLLLLSIIPSTLVLVYISVLRIQQRLILLLGITGFNMVFSLILTYVLLTRYGLVGIGVGWLVASCVSLVFIVLILRILGISITQNDPIESSSS